MTKPDDIDRAVAGGSAVRIEPQRDEPPPLTIWQRLFNWLDSRISRWVSGD